MSALTCIGRDSTEYFVHEIAMGVHCIFLAVVCRGQKVSDMKIEDLKCTCDACPSRWEFKTDGNRSGYARYRFGFLSVKVSEPGSDFVEIFGKHLTSDNLDGCLDWSFVEGFIKDIDIDNTLASLRNNHA
jgi:hypothetical protein